MDSEFKLATNLTPYSRVSDRFVTARYTEEYEFNKKLEMVAAVDGIMGIDLAWPCQFPSPSSSREEPKPG